MTARQELAFLSPWCNAAGFGGFTPGGAWQLEEPQGMFFTSPVSLKPVPFSMHDRLLPCAGGFLLDGGRANPGLARVLKINAGSWRSSKIPVCVHIRPEDPSQAAEMVRMIEECECSAAIELECPPGCDPQDMPPFWKAAAGELPLITCLPLGTYGRELMSQAAAALEAVCLGAPRGMLPDENGQTRAGRLYGPGLLPQILAEVIRWKASELRIIAGAGLFRKSEADAALAAGAAAVQLDAVLWRPGGWFESNT